MHYFTQRSSPSRFGALIIFPSVHRALVAHEYTLLGAPGVPRIPVGVAVTAPERAPMTVPACRTGERGPVTVTHQGARLCKQTAAELEKNQ